MPHIAFPQLLPDHPRTRKVLIVAVVVILVGLALQMIYAGFHGSSPRGWCIGW